MIITVLKYFNASSTMLAALIFLF